MGRLDQLRGWFGGGSEKVNFAEAFADVRPQKRDGIDLKTASGIALWLGQDDIKCAGYTRLCDNAQIMTACLKIAELIGSMTIYLMNNTENGDERIINELSRKIDIEPCENMTRIEWMTAVVMNMLLYGEGNSVVVPHTKSGILQDLEPISAHRVNLQAKPGSYKDYTVYIDGKPHNPADVLHFAYNPDPKYLWKGRGLTVVLKDVANNIKQAQKTENAYML